MRSALVTVNRYACVLFLLSLLPVAARGMAVKTDSSTNEKIKFAETYTVGLLAFENVTTTTNIDYLAISLPLMLKEELKLMTDFFVERGDVLLEKEEINWERTWQQIKAYPVDEPLVSRTLDGKPVVRTNADKILADQKKKGSLRKKLLFSSELVVRNDQTLDEVAKKQKWHFILTGSFAREGTDRVRVRVALYNAIRGLVIGHFEESFPEERVLLELKGFATRMRARLVSMPVANLRIESDPDVAMIYINKQFIGYTPCDITGLAATNHEIQLRKDGYGLRTFSVTLLSNRNYVFKEKLVVAADYGVVRVSSDPPGATVLVDLVSCGVTPCIVTNLRAGLYRLSLDKDGYVFAHRQIEVKKGVTNSVVMSLDKKEPGALTIDQRTERMRTWMNITFWTGAATLAGYAWSYFNYQDHYDRFQRYYSAGDTASALTELDKSKPWRNTSNLMLNATVGCLAASGYFLVRYLILDNKDLGLGPGFMPDGLTMLPDQPVLLHWRF